MKAFRLSSLAVIVMMLMISRLAFSADKVASYTRTVCQPIQLELSERPVELEDLKVSLLLEKQAEFESGEFSVEVVKTSNQENVDVPGLEVEVLKTVPVDNFEFENQSWVLTKTFSQVLGVKVKVRAAEGIGYELRGDVMLPSQNIDAYTICQEDKEYYQ